MFKTKKKSLRFIITFAVVGSLVIAPFITAMASFPGGPI
ncbi:hypothetical protein CLROS_002590 [Clostridium felsineum]|uniref:Uncharacterized protein n=1 Tax=Clostridium felsineum TaxID=36839 RepID=A0A1S8KXL3_9CLOT|nr:hypothetical protein CLAUR_023070 [Clostridium felsineum]URZ04935.1 hypothetical protein CLROS_002590 [Clostridium felsineum]URZ09976.1 hypothetical protein CROST_006840 [Clostridium felsineum]